MEYDGVLKLLAPCGLNCSKCMAFADGDIKKHAEKLKELLGSFDVYAERFSGFSPVFNNYPQFKELLEHFAQAGCRSCRTGACGFYSNCGVAACFRDKGVDFCFQCGEFPCDRTNFDTHLRERWINMNTRMKEIGVEKYYEEIKDKARYS
ncbi:MAG TPA: DUF3795 domain-containing protein [Syntrophorhabdaceae bacterium]|nr:DUF3795 domain-containing protein [Syntrophorhabdaceae bacterium]